MPLPLIPLVLIAVGGSTGLGGLLLATKGARDFRKASHDVKGARTRYERRRALSEIRVAATNDGLAALGRQQQAALVDVVLRMGAFLRRHERLVRETERLLVDGIEATTGQVPGVGGLDVEAVTWLSGALGSAAVGAGTGAEVTAAATGFGVASTGTAISGLSGAAAESATMAFLGGGSLASGGGGMALGATTLNVVTIGPALLVAGFVIKGQGTKALTQARGFEATIAGAIAELGEMDAQLAAVDSRVEELSAILEQLVVRAVASLDLLESEPFVPQAHAARFQRALTLVMAVRDVAATPVIAAQGELTERSAKLIVKYRAMAEEKEVG